MALNGNEVKSSRFLCKIFSILQNFFPKIRQGCSVHKALLFKLVKRANNFFPKHLGVDDNAALKTDVNMSNLSNKLH